MLILNTRIDAATRVHGTLALPWDRRERCRMRATLACGEEVALFLPRGAPLRHGDLLRGDDGRVVRVAAAPEPTYALRCPDPLVLARCAYQLGKRHARLQVCAWGLRMRAEPVLRDLVLGLGAAVEEELAAFEPEADACAATLAGAGNRPATLPRKHHRPVEVDGA
ncbi:urease accessory protein UreE [Massilia sp. LC238]|uniref:urease accessory protein UreE n=1 Tax=Massilia sp. LC238 TaxID=1502852 RepID=UPI0004E293DD|nr:urease accessory protein UreE [Massilia sp. LC238]KFC63787.1 Urease accessory protein UreE [Massilia sp. LC238]